MKKICCWFVVAVDPDASDLDKHDPRESVVQVGQVCHMCKTSRQVSESSVHIASALPIHTCHNSIHAARARYLCDAEFTSAATPDFVFFVRRGVFV
jgi:hypothetical protein